MSAAVDMAKTVLEVSRFLFQPQCRCFSVQVCVDLMCGNSLRPMSFELANEIKICQTVRCG